MQVGFAKNATGLTLQPREIFSAKLAVLIFLATWCFPLSSIADIGTPSRSSNGTTRPIIKSTTRAPRTTTRSIIRSSTNTKPAAPAKSSTTKDTVSTLTTPAPEPTPQLPPLQARLVDNMSSELGFPLYTWSTNSDPSALVVAIHGATLHGRSYTTIAEKLSKKGYAVFAPDMRGFGSWYHDEHPEDAEAKSILYRRSENDLQKLLAKLREQYPSKPIYLMGESVGANMAVRLLAIDGTCADGLILSSPAIKQRLFFGPSVLKQIITVFFINPTAQLDITPFIKSRVSESPEITEERVTDELGRNKMNAGELFKTRWFNKVSMEMAPVLPSHVPILIIEGSIDKLFHAKDIQSLMAELPMTDKKLHLLNGKGHIHLETKYLKPEVENVVSDWLADKSSKYAKNQNDGSSKVSSLSESKAVTP